MRKLRILSTCLNEVSAEMEIDKRVIMSGNKSEDAVDARHLLVKLMHDAGLYPNIIAQLIGCTSRNVNSAISNFNLRCEHRKLLRNSYEKLRKHIGNNCFTT